MNKWWPTASVANFSVAKLIALSRMVMPVTAVCEAGISYVKAPGTLHFSIFIVPRAGTVCCAVTADDKAS